jgi:hypothetical protein
MEESDNGLSWYCTDLQNSPYPIITEGNFWYLISKNTVIQSDGLL